jgi:16S rRNA (guanine966-N2)-methyltransferase
LPPRFGISVVVVVRITGGSARGRKLVTPRSDRIRPTCDRVREALFNILGSRIIGARVLDLFAGTGAIGTEALSRGASFALFVDHSLEAGRLIEANLRACLSRPAAAFVQLNLAGIPNLQPLRAALEAERHFDLVFMDPPYQKNLAERLLGMVEEANILAPNALIVVEEHHSVNLPETLGTLAVRDHRRYGETGLWLYDVTLHTTHD